MLKCKYDNPLSNFICHGTKVISGFTYILLVDETGQTLIEQIASDNSTILFNQMPPVNSDQKNVIASSITEFWATPATGPFVYLFQL